MVDFVKGMGNCSLVLELGLAEWAQEREIQIRKVDGGLMVAFFRQNKFSYSSPLFCFILSLDSTTDNSPISHWILTSFLLLSNGLIFFVNNSCNDSSHK